MLGVGRFFIVDGDAGSEDRHYETTNDSPEDVLKCIHF